MINSPRTRFCIVSFLLVLFASTAFADPPKPPVGKRWVMNPNFSDEFNGTELDSSKWLDHHPTWRGRAPGLFMPEMVTVADGYLQLKGEKMDEPQVIHTYGKDVTYSVKGAAVVSKNTAFLGYYETRVKAAATTMSTTFWFSSGKNYEGPHGTDKYGLEWDIQECIGRPGDFEGKYFAYGMHSNSHFWYTDVDGERHDYRAPQVKFNDPEVASANFHVYGGWWHDESMASYYYDNGPAKYQKFYDDVKAKPFDQEMFMRIVCETYPFPWIALPTDEELADPTKNVVYYDWVRGYELVDADDAHEELESKSETEIGLYYEDITIDQIAMEMPFDETLSIPLSYKANEDCEIRLILKDTEGNKIAESTYPAYIGYANVVFDFESGGDLDAAAEYDLVAELRSLGDEPQTINSSLLVITSTAAE